MRRGMKLIEVARILSLLDESIDIHGLARLHQGDPGFERAVKDYRFTLQGRKRELLAPFGLDDLDKFKENPEGFVKMVGYAVDSFKEKREQKALYKKVYENDRCLITMPKGPKGAAAAGSLFKVNGKAVCPWCVALKYPENEKFWERYMVETVFFVYAKEGGSVSDAWCVLLTPMDCRCVLGDSLSVSHIEDTANDGRGGDEDVREGYLEEMCRDAGLGRERLCAVFKEALLPRRAGIEERCKGFLLADGADPGARVEYGRTALHIAVDFDNAEICKALIGAGADIDAQDQWRKSPLMNAAGRGSAALCRLLLDAGANVNGRDGEGRPPLAFAVAGGFVEVCRLLLDLGADVNARDNFGWTPLLHATSKGRLETCKLLIDAGADVNLVNTDGFTALDYALNPETRSLLVSHGAKSFRGAVV